MTKKRALIITLAAVVFCGALLAALLYPREGLEYTNGRVSAVFNDSLLSFSDTFEQDRRLTFSDERGDRVSIKYSDNFSSSALEYICALSEQYSSWGINVSGVTGDENEASFEWKYEKSYKTPWIYGKSRISRSGKEAIIVTCCAERTCSPVTAVKTRELIKIYDSACLAEAGEGKEAVE